MEYTNIIKQLQTKVDISLSSCDVIYARCTNYNHSLARKKYLLFVSNKHLVLVHILNSDIVQDYIVYQYNDIKTLSIIHALQYELTIHFKNSEALLLKIGYKKNGKDLVKKVIHQLQQKKINSTVETSIKKFKRKQKMNRILYILTLVPFLGSAYFIFNGITLILVCLAIFVAHMLLFTFVETAISRMIDMKFSKKYSSIINSYTKNKNINKLIIELQTLENVKKTQKMKNIYCLALCSAYIHTNNKKQAMHYMNQVVSSNEKESFNKTKEYYIKINKM